MYVCMYASVRVQTDGHDAHRMRTEIDTLSVELAAMQVEILYVCM